MDDPTQAPPEPTITPSGAATFAAAELPAPTGPDGQGRRISRGLFAWLLIIAFGGLVSVLMGEESGALFFAMAGVFVLAQASDAAAALEGFRDWVHFNVPAREFRGMLFRALVRSLIPFTGALFYAGIGAWALKLDPLDFDYRLAAGWSFGAAILCALLVWRPAADLVTRACFRTGSIGRTRRLTARIVVMALLLPVPMRLLFPEMLDIMKSSKEPLASASGLTVQLLGEIAIAAAGVGLLVRRNWSEARERLGLVAMRPAHFGVALLGLAAIIGLNSGMEWLQEHYFHTLWLQDGEMTKLIAQDLPLATTLLLGLSAGFGEEISLRGALQPRLGILLTSLVFASAHVQYSWFGMLTTALLGLLLGTVRARTNTTTAIVVHALYDVYAALSSQG